MSLSDLVYSLGWQTVRPFLAAAGLFSPKLARAMAGRRDAVDAMREWAAAGSEAAGDGAREGGRGGAPLVWLHGASAGELAGAVPVVAELRRRMDIRLAVTCSSPSGEATARRLDPDYHGFVPLDLRRHTDVAVECLRPAVLVYAKHDVWPNLTASSHRSGVPVALVNATVRPGSRRLRQPGRAVLARAYRSLDGVGAVSDSDADRLAALGVRREVIRVTGDASFDQAIARLDATADRPLRLPPRIPGVVRLIAGSTWSADDALLVDAIADQPATELVLVPHEPSPTAVGRIGELVRDRLDVEPRVFTELAGTSAGPMTPGLAPPPLVVDTVGILAELYTEADLAYVGGALAGTGLHSVIEPAAAGLPVVFGSRHDRWEAEELVSRGAAFEVEETSMHATLVSLLDAKRRRNAGRAALNYVADQAGAGRRGADLLLELLADRGVTRNAVRG